MMREGPIEIHGIKRKVSLHFISTMKVKCCMRQGCRLYIVEVVSDGKGPSLDQYPILSKFKDVFPKEFQGYLLKGNLISQSS
jgi:hypothetical protein